MEFLIIFLTATAPTNPLTISAGRSMGGGRMGVCPGPGPGAGCASLAGGVAKALLRHYKVNIVDAFRFPLCQ